MGASGVTMIAIGLIFAAITAGVLTAGGPDEASEWAANPAGATLQGTMLAQLIIGVLGVMAITSEYATGTIRTTLAVVPKRLPVLVAKAAVIIAVTFPAMLVSTVVAFFAGQAIIGTSDLAAANVGDPGVLRAIIGTAGYLTGIAVLGVAIGTLLRSTAVAISTLYLPANAGSAFSSVVETDGLLSVVSGTGVFLAWVLVPLAAAAVVLKRRSA